MLQPLRQKVLAFRKAAPAVASPYLTHRRGGVVLLHRRRHATRRGSRKRLLRERNRRQEQFPLRRRVHHRAGRRLHRHRPVPSVRSGSGATQVRSLVEREGAGAARLVWVWTPGGNKYKHKIKRK
ncbi:unnamed protein product [Amoebophrya sp. A120]|nr:unnamed protein product [Amoebophrya sp. A120]|eukprot:GSA120T00008122001.1